jgi:large subunit ribosomal protein L10
MKQEDKAACTAELQDGFGRAHVAVLTDYRGLEAQQLDQLRREVRAANGRYRVAKNTLTRRALGPAQAGQIGAMLRGPTAIVFGFTDPVSVVKVVVRFAKDHEALSIKGGLLDGQVLAPEAIQQLAELPSREEMLGRLLALLKEPATRLLRTINQPGAQVVQLLEAVRRRGAETEAG